MSYKPGISPMIVVAPVAGMLPFEGATALERVCELIVDAGALGARWIAFPPACLPGYPDWIWDARISEHPTIDDLRAEAMAGAVRIPGDMTDRLCRVAQRARINVLIGVIEISFEAGDTALYDTLLVVDAQGQIAGRYRAPLRHGDHQRTWISCAGDPPDATRQERPESRPIGVGGI
jgi:nitrilase